MANSPAETNAELLRSVLSELRRLNEVMESFTNDGFPLQRTIPTTEMLAAMVVAAAMISRTDPRITPQDLKQRLTAAPVISSQLIDLVDSYLNQTQLQALEERLQAP